MKTRRGYTLIEVLLAIAFMGIITGIGIPFSKSFVNKNNLDVAVNTFVQGIRRAEVLARAGDSDTTWGVYATSGALTLFRGPSYSGRDAAGDEVYDISESIVISGISEYVFAKMTGYPAIAGTTTLRSIDNDEKTITINAKGTASY